MVEFIKYGGRDKWRCKACRYEYVKRSRQKTKRILVEEYGGKCIVPSCGYSRCIRALHFHHLDPKLKEFSIAANTRIAALDKLREETKKCILLCSNCHMELEDGLLDLGSISPHSDKV